MPRPDPLPDRHAATDEEIRRRQRTRSIVTALILFALVALFYAISIVKML